MRGGAQEERKEKKKTINSKKKTVVGGLEQVGQAGQRRMEVDVDPYVTTRLNTQKTILQRKYCRIVLAIQHYLYRTMFFKV